METENEIAVAPGNSMTWRLFVLLLLPALALGAGRCMTEKELRGGAAAGFLMTQEISARLCSLRYGPKRGAAPMGSLHLKIAAKFKAQWDALATVREVQYRRWYGAAWRQQMNTDNAEAARLIMAGLRLSAAVCANLNSEIEIRLASEWAYIESKLDYGARIAKQSVTVCK